MAGGRGRGGRPSALNWTTAFPASLTFTSTLLLPHPAPPPIFPFPFTIQPESRIQRISLQNQFTEKCIMVHKCQVQFILNFRQCFSFKKSSFKCPVLLTFSYIFYSVFEEDNNLCLILGNSCKDNEILMIFHQVKCELQKKSYWIFMDLNRIKWDSWGIRITILSGPAACSCRGDGEPHEGRSNSHSENAPQTLPSACPKSGNEIWQKFPWLDQWQERSCTACINSSDLCSRSWFTLWLKTSAGLLTNWNQISSAASGIDPYLTSRLRIDWHWLTIKMLSSTSSCQATVENEVHRGAVLIDHSGRRHGSHAPDKQDILMLL